MSTRKESAQRRERVLKHLRKAAQRLQRADGNTNLPNQLEGDGPLNWSFAVGAAKMCIWQALAELGDRALLDEWEDEMTALRQARLAAENKPTAVDKAAEQHSKGVA